MVDEYIEKDGETVLGHRVTKEDGLRQSLGALMDLKRPYFWGIFIFLLMHTHVSS